MKKNILIIALIAASFVVKAQSTAVNLVGITRNGLTDTVDAGPIVVDNTNKVTVSGNKLITGQQYNATCAQQISNAIMTWTSSFNLSTQKCWVTANAVDSYGNIYLTGGVATGTANGVDLFCVAYSSGGSQLWSYSYNGPGSTSDVGTGIVINGSDVFICGASDGTATCLVDFVTISLNIGNGSQQWVSRYNYNNSYDGATSIVYNSVTNYVEVTGPSGTTYTDWDIATVAYKASTGVQQWVNRVANPGGNQDKAFSMATDTLGNVYIAGCSWNSTNSSYDISLQKLDTALNLVWIQKFDGNGTGLDDAGINLALDDSLHIYVVGTSFYQDTTLSNLTLLKYNNSGTLIWSKKKRPSATGSSAEGIRVKVKNMDEIFVGGNFITNNNQDIGWLRYDRFGNQNVERFYDGTLNGKDKFLDLALGDSNYVYVSGRTPDGAGMDTNIVLTYQYKEFNPSYVGDSMLKYTSDELIIGFHPKVMKMTKINNRGITYGRLGDFVADSTCNKINCALGCTSTYCQDFAVRKIFDLTEADSISESRLGDPVRIPKFYSNVVVTLPESYSLVPARDSIKKIKPDLYYADLNLVLKLTAANDPSFAVQHSLHTTTLYPNANINVDSAWTVTSGKSSIKVGVYDSGIETAHEDFVGMSSGGYDFITQTQLTFVDGNNHGTPVAGIIGARRNNNKGIAGIAGGDVDSSNIGVSVYDCRVVNNQGSLASMTVLAQALNQGARSTTVNGGFGLNLMNNSYYISVNDKDTMTYPLIQDQLVFASLNGVAWVGAKANWWLAGGAWATFPADWNPEITSCVGMSGNNGNNCAANNNTACTYNNLNGYGLDFVAPGTVSTVISPTVQQWATPDGYAGVAGCSMAAPHVTGVMALMMSYWNKPSPNNWDNLTHEDCENIIKRNCTDLTNATYSETVGFDAVSGAGRVNAYQALKHLNKNYYRLRHIDLNNHSITYTTSVQLVSSASPKYWRGYYQNAPVYSPSYIPTPLNPGTYTTEIYKIETTITYTLNPSEKIIGYWPFYKGCRGWSPDTANPRPGKPYWAKIDTVNNTTAKMTTYLWKNINNGYSYPALWQYLHGSITLYTYDSTATAGEKENESALQRDFQVFPNPSFNEFKLSFYTERFDLLNYQIFDILGREIKKDIIKPSFGKNIIDINFAGSFGVYILKVFDRGRQVYVQKLIKNE